MTPPKPHEKVLGLARNFMESRILLTAAELDLFSFLAGEPKSAGQATEFAGGPARAMTYLLDALAAMELLEKKDDLYKTPSNLEPFLKANSPDSVLPMILHAAGLWQSWSRLTSLVKGDETAPVRKRDAAGLKAFIGAMHAVGAPQADRIVGTLDLSGVKKVLDVGGGSGTYTMAFLKADPEIRGALFDLPDVVAMARERLSQNGLLERVDLVEGDYNRDRLPPGQDLVLLSAIIHQNSPEQNRSLFKKIHDALNHGGRLIIRDHIMNKDRTTPRAGAIFAINMLVNTPGGGTFTLDEIEIWLKEAGFSEIALVNTGGPGMDGLVEAKKNA